MKPAALRSAALQRLAAAFADGNNSNNQLNLDYYTDFIRQHSPNHPPKTEDIVPFMEYMTTRVQTSGSVLNALIPQALVRNQQCGYHPLR
jgi:hypothetical protein